MIYIYGNIFAILLIDKNKYGVSMYAYIMKRAQASSNERWQQKGFVRPIISAVKDDRLLAVQAELKLSYQQLIRYAGFEDVGYSRSFADLRYVFTKQDEGDQVYSVEVTPETAFSDEILQQVDAKLEPAPLYVLYTDKKLNENPSVDDICEAGPLALVLMSPEDQMKHNKQSVLLQFTKDKDKNREIAGNIEANCDRTVYAFPSVERVVHTHKDVNIFIREESEREMADSLYETWHVLDDKSVGFGVEDMDDADADFAETVGGDMDPPKVVLDLGEIIADENGEMLKQKIPPRKLSPIDTMRFYFTEAVNPQSMWSFMNVAKREEILKRECLRGDGKTFESIKKYQKQEEQEASRYIDELCSTLKGMGVSEKADQMTVLYALTQGVGGFFQSLANPATASIPVSHEGDVLGVDQSKSRSTMKKEGNLIRFNYTLPLILGPLGPNQKTVGLAEATLTFDTKEHPIKPRITAMQYSFNDKAVVKNIKAACGVAGDVTDISVQPLTKDELERLNASEDGWEFVDDEVFEPNDEKDQPPIDGRLMRKLKVSQAPAAAKDSDEEWDTAEKEFQADEALGKIHVKVIIPQDNAESQKLFKNLDKNFNAKTFKKFEKSGNVMPAHDLVIKSSKFSQRTHVKELGQTMAEQIEGAGRALAAPNNQKFSLVFRSTDDKNLLAYITCVDGKAKIVSFTKDVAIKDNAKLLSKNIINSLRQPSGTVFKPAVITSAHEPHGEQVAKSAKDKKLVSREEFQQILSEKIESLRKIVKQNEGFEETVKLFKDKIKRSESLMTLFNDGLSVRITDMNGNIIFCHGSKSSEVYGRKRQVKWREDDKGLQVELREIRGRKKVAEVISKDLITLKNSIDIFIVEAARKQGMRVGRSILRYIDNFEVNNKFATEQDPDTSGLKAETRSNTNTESVTNFEEAEIKAWYELEQAVDNAFAAIDDSEEKLLKLNEWKAIKEEGIGRYMYMPEKPQQMVINLTNLAEVASEITDETKLPKSLTESDKARFLLTQMFALNNFWSNMDNNDENNRKLKHECLRGEGGAFKFIKKYQSQEGENEDAAKDRYIRELCDSLSEMGIQGVDNQLTFLYAFTQNVGNCAHSAGRSIAVIPFENQGEDILTASSDYDASLRIEDDFIYVDIRLDLVQMLAQKNVGKTEITVAFNKNENKVIPRITSMKHIIYDHEVQESIQKGCKDNVLIHIENDDISDSVLTMDPFSQEELEEAYAVDKAIAVEAVAGNLVTRVIDAGIQADQREVFEDSDFAEKAHDATAKPTREDASSPQDSGNGSDGAGSEEDIGPVKSVVANARASLFKPSQKKPVGSHGEPESVRSSSFASADSEDLRSLVTQAISAVLDELGWDSEAGKDIKQSFHKFLDSLGGPNEAASWCNLERMIDKTFNQNQIRPEQPGAKESFRVRDRWLEVSQRIDAITASRTSTESSLLKSNEDLRTLVTEAISAVFNGSGWKGEEYSDIEQHLSDFIASLGGSDEADSWIKLKAIVDDKIGQLPDKPSQPRVNMEIGVVFEWVEASERIDAIIRSRAPIDDEQDKPGPQP